MQQACLRGQRASPHRRTAPAVFRTLSFLVLDPEPRTRNGSPGNDKGERVEGGGDQHDTFLEDARPLLDEAEQPGNAAVLIELKQLFDGDEVTEAKLRSRTNQALDQAKRYQQHLVANPRWAGHKVFVLVVYDGPIHYKTAHPDVMLIYLGEGSPSQGSKLLSLDAAA